MSRFLLFIAIMPVYWIGLYIYKKDKNKESKKFLKKLFISGIGSCFITIILTLIISLIFPIITADINDLNLFELFIHVFIGVALIEEFSKWIMVYTISYNNENFDEIYDVIVYAVFVSLGFACLENIIYVLSGGIGTGIIRALLAVPGHACDGIFMGLFLGRAKKSNIEGNKNNEVKNTILSLLVPVSLHGIYDYCIMTQKTGFIIAFFIFIIILYILSIKNVKKVSNNNTYLKKHKYCGMCGNIVTSNFCTKCGFKSDINNN